MYSIAHTYGNPESRDCLNHTAWVAVTCMQARSVKQDSVVQLTWGWDVVEGTNVKLYRHTCKRLVKCLQRSLKDFQPSPVQNCYVMPLIQAVNIKLNQKLLRVLQDGDFAKQGTCNFVLALGRVFWLSAEIDGVQTSTTVLAWVLWTWPNWGPLYSCGTYMLALIHKYQVLQQSQPWIRSCQCSLQCIFPRYSMLAVPSFSGCL